MPTRRDFLKVSTVAGVASAAMTMKASSYDNVPGANERINIAFLGVGGRCQQSIRARIETDSSTRNSTMSCTAAPEVTAPFTWRFSGRTTGALGWRLPGAKRAVTRRP